jgi:hypothetical protein
VNNDPVTPNSLAPETAQAPQTKPLFGLSRELGEPPAPGR